MLLHRSGPYALYGNAFANGECVFTMTDMLAFHTTLGSGGLTELKEGHIGLLAVPLQTLPRRGATDAAPLHALEQAKFLVELFRGDTLMCRFARALAAKREGKQRLPPILHRFEQCEDLPKDK